GPCLYGAPVEKKPGATVAPRTNTQPPRPAGGRGSGCPAPRRRGPNRAGRVDDVIAVVRGDLKPDERHHPGIAGGRVRRLSHGGDVPGRRLTLRGCLAIPAASNPGPRGARWPGAR